MNKILRVRMNLTSMHREQSFISEQVTQMLFGDEVEVLEDYGKWIKGKCLKDGYIGCTYKDYLGDFELPKPDYIVKDPIVLVRNESDGTEILTRVLGGTKTNILDEDGEWVKIRASQDGWIPRGALRAYSDIPTEKTALRRMVCDNALSMIGVPYLWGGSSACGIDCSGLAQWSYRTAGISILRDAHEQYQEERKVEPPFLPGDLVFYFEEENGVRRISHVSISLGGWVVIHSSRKYDGVYISDVQNTPHLKNAYFGAARYIL